MANPIKSLPIGVVFACAVFVFEAPFSQAANIALPANNPYVRDVGHIFFHDTLWHDGSLTTYAYTRGNGGFGYDFGGLATGVDSFTITQAKDGSRARLKDVDIYTDAGKESFTLPDDDATHTFFLSSPVSTDYLMVRPRTRYAGSDLNMRIAEFAVNGTAPSVGRYDLALTKPVTLFDTPNQGWGNYFGGGGTQTPAEVTSGNLFSGNGHYGYAVWMSNKAFSPTNNYIEIDLGSPQPLDRVAVTQFEEGVRDMVNGFRLAFSNDAFSSTLGTVDFSLDDGETHGERTFAPVTARYVRFIGLSQHTYPDGNHGVQGIQLFGPSPTVQLGNALIARAAGSDGVTNLLGVWPHTPIPTDGTIESVSVYNGSGSGSFRFFLLRPTGTPNEYDVIAEEGPFAPSVGVNTFDLSAPLAASAGDVFAHYGNGISYDAGVAGVDTTFYPATQPTVGIPITLPGTGYTLYGQQRIYSLAVEFEPIPEPSTLALAALGMLGLLGWGRRRKR